MTPAEVAAYRADVLPIVLLAIAVPLVLMFVRHMRGK